MKKIFITLVLLIGLIILTNCEMAPNFFKLHDNELGRFTLKFKNLDSLMAYQFESNYDFSYNYYLNKKFLEKYDLYFDNVPTDDMITCNPYEYLSFPKLLENDEENNLLKSTAVLRHRTNHIQIGMWKMRSKKIVPLIYDQTDVVKSDKKLFNKYIDSKAKLLESLEIAATIKINYEIIPFVLFIPQYAYLREIIINDDDILEIETEMKKLKKHEEYRIKVFLPREEGKYLINQISFFVPIEQYINNLNYETFTELKRFIPYFNEYFDNYMLEKESIVIKSSKIYGYSLNYNEYYYEDIKMDVF